MTRPDSPWWHPDRHEDRRPFLLARGRIKAELRAWFGVQGFIEVETGCLQVSPGNEAHLHAFKTELIGSDLVRRPLYLHTSPEFAMKKLLAAGEAKIFTFAPVFRNREQGPVHASEFTMLEWYRAGEPYSKLWDDCQAILRIAAQAGGQTQWRWRGKKCDIGRAVERVTVDEAFDSYAGIHLLDDAYGQGVPARDGFAVLAQRAGLKIAAGDSWLDIFSRVLVEKIEPHLGSGAPVLLDEYPALTSALARPCAHDPRVAERFELFVCGVELANGFGELVDAKAQRANLEREMALKQERYGERYPIDEDFIAALDWMTDASGCAMGLDRLVMLATGAERLDQVIWTPLV